MRRLLYRLFSTRCFGAVPVGFWHTASAPAAASATDNFNRADADPMSTTMSDGVSTWTVGPGAFVGMLILSNTAGRNDTGYGAVYVSSPSFTGNQSATITLAGPAVTLCYPIVRGQSGSSECYIVRRSADNWTLQVYRLDSSAAETTVGSAIDLGTHELTTGDQITLEITGTSPATLKVKLNGVQQGSDVTDVTPLTGGQPGCGSGGVNYINAFSATDL